MSTESTAVSRRSFLTGAATAGAAVAAGVPTARADEAQSASYLPETWDYETDVLVIGYGGAGVWAALTAADEGGSEVLILEKAPFAAAATPPSTLASSPSPWMQRAVPPTSSPSPMAS